MKPDAAAKAAARARKQRRALAFAVSQLAVALAAFALAVWLVAARVRVPFVNLPFGLFTLCVVSALSSGDALLGAWRRRAQPAGAMHAQAAARAWHALELADALAALSCDDVTAGLSTAEAARRYTTHGGNALAPPPPRLNLFVKLLDEVRTLRTRVHAPEGTRAPTYGACEQVHEPQQQLLLVVAVLFALVGEAEEAALALSVIFVMALCEVWTEARAKAAVRTLGASAPASAAVLRGGDSMLLERQLLVPGDVLLLRAGHEVPADARLLEARGLSCDESRLTGESIPVVKHAAAALDAATPLAERANIVHAGTLVTRGAGRAVVCATGSATELGSVLHAARRAAGGPQPPTPLQRLLRSLAGTLSIVALVASIAGGLLGLARSMAWQDVILCALSLAFATIPEELPILTAAVLALGSRALSARGIFVKRLRALESLACVDTVLIDKTGTLTTGTLRLARVLLPAGSAVEVAPQQSAPAGELAALLHAWRRTADDACFDPFDAAVTAAFLDAPETPSAGGTQPASCAALPAAELMLFCEAPFDPTTKLSARAFAHVPSGSRVTFVKGAPDALLPLCTLLGVCVPDGAALALQPLAADAAVRLAADIEAAAAQGLRTLAFARAVAPAGEADATSGDAVADLDLSRCGDWQLALLGVLCFDDPPRAEAAAAVAACHAAGIHVSVVSGDHVATVQAVARSVGILPAQRSAADDGQVVHCGDAEAGSKQLDEAPAAASDEPDALPELPAWAVAAAAARVRVLARATPAHKLHLVRAHTAAGRTVLVTGDGANDAPALAVAAVGLAAAAAGDIAREAADVLVVSGDLSSVAIAVQEGRRLHDNLGNALAFYLGAKAGLVILFVVGTLWRGFPLAPVQIVVLELYMDVGASLSFCSEPAEPGIMQRPPHRADARFFDRRMLARIAAGGASMVACVLGGYAWGLYGAQLPLGASEGVRLQHATSMAFVCWLMGHILLAFNQSSSRAPALTKHVARNRAFVAWAAASAVLCVLVGTLQGLDAALALRLLAPRDWGVAVAVCVGGTCWVEAGKWALRLCAPRARSELL
jgi:Ca2+-transporting ATPase